MAENLKTIVIPDTVTKIEFNAFYRDTNIYTRLVIPESVKTIYDFTNLVDMPIRYLGKDYTYAEFINTFKSINGNKYYVLNGSTFIQLK